MRGFLVLALCCIASASLSAGEYNDVLSIGDKAPAWTNLPGTDGKRYSLTDFKDKPIVVVIFTCNSCPCAVDYEDRIMAFTKEFGGPEGKVAVVAINVNKIPADRMDKMQERAKLKNFNYPYLYDETQQIARAYGATYTPEFFVLNQERKIAYMGAMDDRDKAADAKVNYLKAAVQAVLKGEKPAKTETLGRGCKIRYERKRPS
jgi:peroxiredoxin